MKREFEQTREDRRGFLKGLVAAGGAVTLVSATGISLARDRSGETAADAPAPSAGYHETDHIRRYYRLAGL